MKATDAGFVALRFLSLWYGLAGLVGIPSSLTFLTWGAGAAGENRWIGIALALANLVVVALAAYVFVNAWKVSRFLFGSAGDLELTSPAGSVQAVAFSLLGAVFVLGAIPELATKLAQLLWVLRAGAHAEREAFLASPTFFEALYSALSLGLGAFVFVRSRWLVERWAGFQKPPEDPAAPTEEPDPTD